MGNINIYNIIHSLTNQDYILIGFLIFSGVTFSLLKLNTAFKLYYGVLTGFVIFLLFNLGLNNLNDNNLELLNGLRDSLVNLKNTILYISFLSILFLPFLFLTDYSINFKQINNKILNILFSFILGFLFPIFIISILLSIINNKLLFGVDNNFLNSLNNLYIIKYILLLFNSGNLFSLINQYAYLISFSFFIYLFYKLTFSGLVILFIHFLINKINDTFFKNKKEEK